MTNQQAKSSLPTNVKYTWSVFIVGILFGAAVAAGGAYVLTRDKGAQFDIRLSKNIEDNDPSCLRVYHYIELYADSFQIPRQYAYGIAHAETGYKGPLHWKYNHQQTSPAGAVGPMQIMPSTARWINKDKVSVSRLRTDIEYNVMTSMKLLRYLYDKNGDWQLTFGEYNTGRPCVNSYAKKVYSYNGPQYDSTDAIITRF